MAQSQKMSLNVKKAHYMVIHGKRKPNFQMILRIGGELLNDIDNTKFLGVIVDNKFTWRDHITYICGTIARGIGTIIKARKLLNKYSLISLYHSFIHPYLINFIHVWGTTYKTYTEPLTVLQKN